MTTTGRKPVSDHGPGFVPLFACLWATFFAPCTISTVAAEDALAAFQQDNFKPAAAIRPKLVHETDPRLYKTIRGLVVPRQHATISSRLQATIGTIGPDNGERFKKGQSLVTFDCAIFNAELQRAEAQLSAAKDTHRVKSELARNGTISKLQLVLAAAELKKAEAERVLSSEHVAHCTITAPYDGRVVRRLANAHETMNVGAPLIEIVNDREVELQLYVPSKWLPHLKPGTTFRFHVDETQDDLEATIIAIGAWIDNVSQLIEIRAICPGSTGKLLSGMSGRAEFKKFKSENF